MRVSRPEVGVQVQGLGQGRETASGAGREEKQPRGHTLRRWIGKILVLVRERGGRTPQVIRPVGAHPAGCLDR